MAWDPKQEIKVRCCMFKGCTHEMGYDGYEMHRYYAPTYGHYIYLCPKHAELVMRFVQGWI